MKRIIFISLFLIVILLAAPSVMGAELVESGTCGSSCSWFYYDDGSLVISGSGAMTDYSSASAVPWYDYRTSVTSLTIDDRISRIGAYAFYKLPISSVTLPSSLTYIYKYAFAYSSLTSVVFPSSLTSILENAFNYCESLSSVSFNEGLLNIYKNAFSNCAFDSIVIPSTVNVIQDYAFRYIETLESVYMLSDSPPTLGSSVFTGSSVLEGIYVSADSLAAYESASSWSAWKGYLKVGSPDPVVIPDFSVITSWDPSSSYLVQPNSSGWLFSVQPSISGYTFTYQWLSSLTADGEFFPMEGQTSSSFLPPSGSNNLGTTFYKCQVTASSGGVSSTVDSPILEVLVSETLPDDSDDPTDSGGTTGGSDGSNEEVIEILDSNNSLLSQIFEYLSSLGQSIGDWFSSLGSSVTSGFASVGNWFTAQTEAITSKLDEVISALTDGTDDQQQAAAEQQQAAQQLQTNVNNVNSSLQQAGDTLSSVAKPDNVDMSISSFGVDYSGFVTLVHPLVNDSLIGTIMSLLATIMLISYVVFGKKG